MGAKIGIAVGVTLIVLALALVGAIAFCLGKKKRNKMTK
jgi:cbb3-type cytochrome oxidase subunit 3